MIRTLAAISRAIGVDGIVHGTVGAVNGAKTRERIFHLTFDDGPDPRITPSVIEVLARHGATATFFVLVDRAHDHPGLIRELIDGGHAVGLHTRTHRRLSTLGWRALRDEILTARRELEALTGGPIKWFRPPYGAQGMKAIPVVWAGGMTTVNWTVDSSDWKGLDRRDPLSAAIGEISAGGIVLLHDIPADPDGDDEGKGYIPKAELTDLYLGAITERGLRPVSLGDLMETGPRIRQARLS